MRPWRHPLSPSQCPNGLSPLLSLGVPAVGIRWQQRLFTLSQKSGRPGQKGPLEKCPFPEIMYFAVQQKGCVKVREELNLRLCPGSPPSQRYFVNYGRIMTLFAKQTQK